MGHVPSVLSTNDTYGWNINKCSECILTFPLSEVTALVVEVGSKRGDVITNKGLNRPPGTQWAVAAHHGGHLKGTLTLGQALHKGDTHFRQPPLSPPPPSPELWPVRSACLPSAWLMCEWRITRSCTYRSVRAQPRPKVLSNYGDPPLRKRNALKTHHAGLVICLIIFQLKTHVETGKEMNTTKLWQWYILF